MENNSHLDTYFFDANTALKEAKKANRVQTANPRITGLQICYYNADEPFENAPENCIWVPFENVYNYFVTTKNRFPRTFNFDNSVYTSHEQYQIANMFNETIQVSKNEREALVNLYVEEIKNYKPNFKDEKLRIFIPACRETTVMQYVSKNIAESLKKYNKEYEIHFFIQDNEMQTCQDMLPFFHAFNEFKPHISISINHFNNVFLNDSVINIVWFQDPMPILLNNEKILLRSNDIVMVYLNEWKKNLAKKGLKEEDIHTQYSCVDTYNFINEKASKENKIIFAGSYYTDESMNNYLSFSNKKINDDIYNIIESKKDLSETNIIKILKKYNIEYKESDLLHLQQLFIRNRTTQWLIELCDELNFSLELYGWGWDKHNDKRVIKYYKGVASHEDLNSLYNTSKYVFLSSGRTINTQRLAEAVASGSFPLSYDSRNITLEKETWDNEILYFKSKNELKNILEKQLEPKNTPEEIINTLSYEKLSYKIIKLIEERINENNL